MSGAAETIQGLLDLGNALLAEGRIQEASVAFTAHGFVAAAVKASQSRWVLESVQSDLESGRVWDAIERLDGFFDAEAVEG